MNEIRVNLEILNNTEKEQLLALLDGAYKRPKRFKPELADTYWSVNDGLVSGANIWSNDLLDGGRYKMGNCFKNKEEAEFEAERQNVVAELENFALENNDEIDWEITSRAKHSLYYDFDEMTLEIDTCYYYPSQGTIYFSSEELCEEVIRKVGKDRIERYIFGVEKV